MTFSVNFCSPSARSQVGRLDEEEENNKRHHSDQDIGRDKGKDEDEADDDEELVEDVLDVHWQSHVHLIDVPESKVNFFSGSRLYKHLENLLTIRPVGVVSKKLIGALSIN